MNFVVSKLMIIFSLSLFLSVLSSCGNNKNVCEKSLEVQQELCEGDEECILCGCVMQGYFCAIEPEKIEYVDRAGILLPDYTGPGSLCAKPTICEEISEEYATRCLENKDMGSCNPWMYDPDLGIILCGVWGFDTVYCE